MNDYQTLKISNDNLNFFFMKCLIAQSIKLQMKCLIYIKDPLVQYWKEFLQYKSH